MANDASNDSTLPLQKLAASFKRLEQLEDYAVRVQAIFISSSFWAKNGPLDSSLTNAVMRSLIDDYLVNQPLDHASTIVRLLTCPKIKWPKCLQELL